MKVTPEDIKDYIATELYKAGVDLEKVSTHVVYKNKQLARVRCLSH